MVLDASGATELVLNTAAGKQLAARLADDSVVVHVPHLTDLETAQGLRRYERHGTLSARTEALALERWRSLDAQRYSHEPLLDRIWQLRDNVTGYDAVYVALAEALRSVLFTGDRKLPGAPGVKVAIELIRRPSRCPDPSPVLCSRAHARSAHR